jgi:hypothetical protein
MFGNALTILATVARSDVRDRMSAPISAAVRLTGAANANVAVQRVKSSQNETIWSSGVVLMLYEAFIVVLYSRWQRSLFGGLNWEPTDEKWPGDKLQA